MIHLRPLPARPVRTEYKPDRSKRKAIHADLRRSIAKPKRRPKYGVTYSQS